MRALRGIPPGSITVTYDRAGTPGTAQVDLASVQRPPLDDPQGTVSTVSALGVGLNIPIPVMVKYGPVGRGWRLGGLQRERGRGHVRGDEEVPGEASRSCGTRSPDAERDAETPISVVGASRIGGEAVENDAWELIVLLFISLNFFVGIFNLLPLLPLDGGHIAIAWFEKVRSWLYARLGRPIRDGWTTSS